MIAFAAPLLTAGCSLSNLAGSGIPATTGSVAQPVEIERPLPETLAYSDAARIGLAARAALWQAEGEAPDEWVNTRTGSSGTLTAARPANQKDNCRPFSTTVTSLAGVHQYSGTLCQAGETRTVLKISEQTAEDS